MGMPTIDGDSPVDEMKMSDWTKFPSTVEHGKLCRNLSRPRDKAKYYLVTDSGQVPRGKGEKNPGRGVK